MQTISYLDSIDCIEGRKNHEWRVSSDFSDTCIHCRNVKDIRDGKIYQWSDDND
ncbi:MAG: hypothetical protein O6761_06865 [Thaumarchaeota archaeon]|nr:hypothetical protein [Nitrososphaerota archaeon]